MTIIRSRSNQMYTILEKIFFSNKFYSFILLILSLIFTSMIVTYDISDNSFNSTSNSAYNNLLGSVGARITDIIIQLWGVASILFPSILLVWSKRLFKHKNITYIYLRIFLLLLSISMLSGMMNYDSLYLPSGCGGIIGYFIVEYFSYMGYFESILLFLSAILLFVSSMGYSQSEQQSICMNFINSTKNLKYIGYFFKSFYFYLKRQKSLPNSSIVKKNVCKEQYPIESSFILPGYNLLGNHDLKKGSSLSGTEINEIVADLLKVLRDFGIKGKIIDIHQGPVVTLYEFEPSAGIKSSRIISLADDIARSLSALSTRIAVVPGRNVLGIELPNKKRDFFGLNSILASKEYHNNMINLPLILGKDISGLPLVADLAKMPHLLIAGTTGSGKSVAINTMIVSLLYKFTPKACKFIMIDPKMLELSVYDGIPHLLTPVVTEPAKAVIALKWAVKEMEERYRNMSNLGVRNILGYNQKLKEYLRSGKKLEKKVQIGFDPDTGKPMYDTISMTTEPMPYIVVIVDEMADLMLVAGKDIESLVQRLAQMARAAGIHLIMATQRPSVDVITGVIKANFPSRISFKVTSKIDSRTILAEQGAEQLLGMGDMLYMGNTTKISRAHGPFVSDREVENITQFLKNQAEPEYVTAVTEEDNSEFICDSNGEISDEQRLYNEAVRIVKNDGKASISYIQRSLRIGYNRAAILVERMEKEGILSSPNHSGKREILIT